jgi:drug/metabolite transporter (DMT)-like permease
MCLWFYSLGGLPLATATTLNYMSSVWMALFLMGGAVMFGARRVEGALVAAVLLGFAGVALVLRPSLDGTRCGTAWPGCCRACWPRWPTCRSPRWARR